VQFNVDAFRKFAAVSNNVEALSNAQSTYNTQMAVLQQELQTALTNLNADHTAIGTAKYSAQVNAISAEMNSLSHATSLASETQVVEQARGSINQRIRSIGCFPHILNRLDALLELRDDSRYRV